MAAGKCRWKEGAWAFQQTFPAGGEEKHAARPGVGIGDVVSNLNRAGYDEATLVAAFTTQFDSQEFLDVLSTHGDNPALRGDIELIDNGLLVRPGETLDLVAFIDGPGGDLGIAIGSLNTSISRIPAPGAVTLLTLAGLAATRRRR